MASKVVTLEKPGEVDLFEKKMSVMSGDILVSEASTHEIQSSHARAAIPRRRQHVGLASREQDYVENASM